MKTLKEALLEHPPQLLRAIADTNHIVLPEGGGRDLWASFLADELARPEVVARAWSNLSNAERAVLDGIVLAGAKVKAFQMVREHGEIRSFGPVALARDKPWQA